MNLNENPLEQFPSFYFQDNEWKDYNGDNTNNNEEFTKQFILNDINNLQNNKIGIKIGTLNVLHDKDPFFSKPILRNIERYNFTINLLQNENFDILCLNEVTTTFLNLIQNNSFFKNNYYFSDIVVTKNCKEQFKNLKTKNKTLLKEGGNLILSKFPINKLFIFKIEENIRPVIYSYFNYNLNKTFIVISAHTSGYEKNFKKRKEQLQKIINILNINENKNINYLLLGDLNIHLPIEEETIKEINCKDLCNFTKDYTFDSWNNSLIQCKYFGMEIRRMRLDRILLNNNYNNCNNNLITTIHCNRGVELFANQPIYKYLKENNLKEDNDKLLNVPFWWKYIFGLFHSRDKEDYLFCSDHFGLKTTIIECTSESVLRELLEKNKEEHKEGGDGMNEDEQEDEGPKYSNHRRKIVISLLTIGFVISLVTGLCLHLFNIK
ncbi:hypothetical protein ABK040_007397 [Willaertia magna]